MDKIKQKLQEKKIEILWEQVGKSIYDKRLQVRYLEAQLDPQTKILFSWCSNNTWLVSIELNGKERFLPLHTEEDILNYLDEIFTTKGVA